MNNKLILVVLFFLSTINVFSQEISRYDVNIGDFKDLKVTDHVNVVYSCNADSAGYAHFMAPKDLADKLTFTNNKKGRLTIQVTAEGDVKKNIPTIYVYSTYLQSVENTADSTVRVSSIAPAPEVKLTNTGNGKIIARDIKASKVVASIITGFGTIIVEGTCTNAEFTNLGTGQIEADKLIATDVTCKLFGTGSIGCNASNLLSIKGSGTGKVYYQGKPKEIKTFQLGSIVAIPLND